MRTFEDYFWLYVAGYLSCGLQGQFACTGRLLLHSFQVLTYARAQRNIWYTRAYTNLPASIFRARSFACNRRAKHG